MGQQWEYCQLQFTMRLPAGQESAPELLATFSGPAGLVNHTLTQQSWLGMFGALGTLEWELVTANSVITGILNQYTAYFKRPQRPGRAIDDVLSILSAWQG
jgi:hypothetical protein